MADVTFDLYKLLVEEVRDAKRARRELANVFMTLNLAGVGALGYLARGAEGLSPALFAWCAFALALTCFIWRTSNSYYVVLLAAKYKEIYALEAKLGVTPLRDEYAAIQGKRSFAKWFSLERAMPLLFILGYAVFFVIQAGGVQLDALWAVGRDMLTAILARLSGH